MAAGGVGSAATTSHSVLGVTIMFLARWINAMRCSLCSCRGSASVNKAARECDNQRMPDANKLVEIRDLHFAYGRRPVLRGVDLDIPKGRVVAILGTSGSGKSTLLQVIVGMLRPARGQVRVFGEDVHALDRQGLYHLRRRMGMMFQQGGLFSDLSTFENVAFPIREHTRLPESILHDLVLMKLDAVGLRGAQRL